MCPRHSFLTNKCRVRWAAIERGVKFLNPDYRLLLARVGRRSSTEADSSTSTVLCTLHLVPKPSRGSPDGFRDISRASRLRGCRLRPRLRWHGLPAPGASRRDSAVGSSLLHGQWKHQEAGRKLRPEGIVNSTAKAFNQIGYHLEASRRFQSR